MQSAVVMVPLIVSMMAGGGFIINEWSHGGLSEAMGMGHHHMLDYARQHCAAVDGSVVHRMDGSDHEHAHAPMNMSANDDAPMPPVAGCSGDPMRGGM